MRVIQTVFHTWMCGGRTNEPVSEAKPHNSTGMWNWTPERRSEAGRGMEAEHHFCRAVEAEAGGYRPELTNHV